MLVPPISCPREQRRAECFGRAIESFHPSDREAIDLFLLKMARAGLLEEGALVQVLADRVIRKHPDERLFVSGERLAEELRCIALGTRGCEQ